VTDSQLDGKVVVVTGASRGIGAGIARCCLDAGASVLGVSRTRIPRSDSERRADISVDITTQGAAEAALAAAIDTFGRADVLINNAAVLVSANCWEQTDAQWDSMIATNLTAPFLLAQTFARHWVENERPGTILNICSLESEIAWKWPPQSVYATTKGALLGLTRAMAFDLAEFRIRVVAIGPGIIETDMTTPDRDATERSIPFRRLGSPADIGRAAVYLCSDEAAYVTGEILYVDGGYKLR
jgi:NAD(P)-dependent dehydrogenase (short-subunit alcohol dehydrogenase family)